jgi:hypothetical protein
MPNDDRLTENSHDDAYRAVLKTLSELHDAWRVHRETVNRAIGLLADEVFRFEKRLDIDDKARIDRQAQIDAKLQKIDDGQAAIQRWQYIRVVIEIVAVIVIVAAFFAFRAGMQQ